MSTEKMEKSEVYFSTECQALGGEILMLKSTWFGHILNSQTGHPYMASKIDLIKRAVKSIASTKQFFRFGNFPQNEWFADYACHDFEPMNKALRIAFKKLDTGVIIIASTYKVPQGVFSYEP
jgi:hypothetical protein